MGGGSFFARARRVALHFKNLKSHPPLEHSRRGSAVSWKTDGGGHERERERELWEPRRE